MSTTGTYENDSYGFAIVIPNEVRGFWNSAGCVPVSDACTCLSDHGRIVPLSAEPYEPERYIEVYAGYAADLDDSTVQQEVDKNLDWIRQRSRADSVTVLKRSNLVLSGLKARRVVVRYFDKRMNSWMIEDFVEALRNRDIEYSVYLRTRELKYRQDLRVFESIVKSFRLTKLE